MKKTSDLIPLAHPGLGVTGVEVQVDLIAPVGPEGAVGKGTGTKSEGSGVNTPRGDGIEAPHGAVHLSCSVTCVGRTGVEMEALCGVSVQLSLCSICARGLDKRMVIGDVKVVRKSGGRSGDWEVEDGR